MITCKLIGRTGNQMFQIATTIAHAKRLGTEFKIPYRSTSEKFWPATFKHLPKLSVRDKIIETYKEPEHSFNPIPLRDGLCLEGYFQSEKYFSDYRKEIIEAFRLDWEFNSGTVSIHVRRGDYLQMQHKHPPITKEYIEAGMSSFEHYRFIFFSDDPNWCRINFPGHVYLKDRSPLMDIKRMSCCEHNIIANSSFSWWGAWLNQNPNKIVIAPSVWFGPGNANLNTKDLIPESWVKI